MTESLTEEQASELNEALSLFTNGYIRLIELKMVMKSLGISLTESELSSFITNRPENITTVIPLTKS